MKRLEYEYESDKTNQLKRQRAFLPEKPFTVGLQNNGATVGIGGVEYQVKEFPVVHHKGGRACSVEYEPMDLNQKKPMLPVRIEVRSGLTTNGLLRSARLVDFKHTKLTSAEAAEAAAQFGGFGPAHHKYRELMNKYRRAGADVSAADAAVIEELCAHFSSEASLEGNSTGERLRRLNIVIDLKRLAGDMGGLEQNYQHYLSTLFESGQFQMLLVGGYAHVEREALQGRYREANTLLERWLDTTASFIDIEAALRFATTELEKGNLWVIVKLLERFTADRCKTAELRFERAAIRYLALHRLREELAKRDATKADYSKAQVELAASKVSEEQLEQMLPDSLADVQRSIKGIKILTGFQTSLKKQIDKIANTRR